MNTTTRLKYALFPNHKRAAHAKRALDASEHGQAEVISNHGGLAHHKLPLHLTRARIGATLGALLVAAAVAVSIAAAVVTKVIAAPAPLAPPLVSLAVLGFIAALFGGLAGALSWSTESCTGIERLRTTLGRTTELPAEHRPAVLLVRHDKSDFDVDRLLGEYGAVQVGTLA